MKGKMNDNTLIIIDPLLGSVYIDCPFFPSKLAWLLQFHQWGVRSASFFFMVPCYNFLFFMASCPSFFLMIFSLFISLSRPIFISLFLSFRKWITSAQSNERNNFFFSASPELCPPHFRPNKSFSSLIDAGKRKLIADKMRYLNNGQRFY